MCEDKNKYSKAVMLHINNDYNKICGMFDSFNGESEKPINKDDLKQFEIGKWYNVNDKVKIRQRNQRFKEYLNFDTIMEEGGEFGKHLHEDLIESAEVLKGEMVDLLDGKTYYIGDVVEYGKGHEHSLIATKYTELHVLFKP